MFIIISGCSGSGKNTIINEIMDRNSNILFLRSCTTREVREGDGKARSQYIHLTKEEFLEKAENGEFIEYEEIHGNYYGILKASVEELKNNTIDYIKDVGVLGRKILINNIGNTTKIISIFIDVPNEILKERLIKRGEKNMELRMSRNEMELSHKSEYEYIIENIDLETAVKEVEKIIDSARKS